MNIIRKAIHYLNGSDMIEEYNARFIAPLMQRAHDRGIPEDEIVTLMNKAFHDADYQVIFPGMLFRDYIDEWIAPNGS